MPEADEVAGDGQGHADHAALGRGVRRLADLAVEGRDGREVDDRAALAVGVGLVARHDGRRLAGHVEGADQVDLDDLAERAEVVRRGELAVAADGALRPADAGGVDARAQRSDLRGGLDGGGDLLGVGHVDPGEDALDLVGEGLALLGVDVGDHDDRAAGGEGAGDGGADAARASGDDG